MPVSDGPDYSLLFEQGRLLAGVPAHKTILDQLYTIAKSTTPPVTLTQLQNVANDYLKKNHISDAR